MIGISTQTSNANGAVIIKEKVASKLYDSTVRVSRVATLDGGVQIVHSGFADGDLTLNISGHLQASEISKLKTIYENQTLVTISTKNACYSGVIKSMNKLHGQVFLNIYIKTKLSA